MTEERIDKQNTPKPKNIAYNLSYFNNLLKLSFIYYIINLVNIFFLTGVCNSIKNPVTKDILFHTINSCRYQPPQRPPPSQGHSDKHLMPPPPKMAKHWQLAAKNWWLAVPYYWELSSWNVANLLYISHRTFDFSNIYKLLM